VTIRSGFARRDEVDEGQYSPSHFYREGAKLAKRTSGQVSHEATKFHEVRSSSQTGETLGRFAAPVFRPYSDFFVGFVASCETGLEKIGLRELGALAVSRIEKSRDDLTVHLAFFGPRSKSHQPTHLRIQ
jgi:hypothetical protein